MLPRKYTFILAVFGQFLLANCAPSETEIGAENRDAKVFLFNVVKFKNGPCASTSTLTSSGSGSGHRNGTCLTENECKDKQGVASGGCAQGFGVCCVFMVSTCGDDVTHNCSYVRNPGFPNTVTGTPAMCAFNVKKIHQNICTIRLDFEAFNIQGPADTVETTGGVCVDSFVASSAGTGQTTPVICGENGGQHLYLDIGANDNDMGEIKFTFATGNTAGRSFEIKVMQLHCDSLSRPPDGCLQYFTGTDGTFQTFNFAANTGHLAEQKYGICIRQESGFCCTLYQPCADDNSYSLDIAKDKVADFVAAEDEVCTADYITIEGSQSNCQLTDISNRYCGQIFADAQGVKASVEICDCTPPFRVGIVTDKTADAKSAALLSRGVCLNYVQTACGQSVP